VPAVDCTSSPGAHTVTDGTVIEDVTLISPERPAPLAHASVVIRDGRIAEIGTNIVAGQGAARVDGRGRYLTPGLIDSHVHVGSMGPLDDGAIAAHPELLQAYRAQLPRSYLAFGFTTLVDLNLSAGAREWFEAAPAHPNLYSAGRAVRVAGGYGAFGPIGNTTDAAAANVVYESTQAKNWPPSIDPRDFTPERAVARVVAAGGICVKVFVEPGMGGAAHWPVPSTATLAALRAETRRGGLPLVVHANGVDAWRAAIGAHADVLAHGLWHWPGDQLGTTPPREAVDVIQSAARAGIRVQPTLQAVYGDQTIFDASILDDPRLLDVYPGALMTYLKGREAQKARLAIADEYRQAIKGALGPAAPDPARVMSIAPARATATLRLMLQERVKLLFGTDTPSNEGIGNPPGLNGRLELARWAEAGAPLAGLLRAATLDNAVAFGLFRELGTIEVGKRADLLLLGADPLKDVAAFDRVETVFVDGKPLSRASLLPAR